MLRLDISEHSEGWCIAWFDEDEGVEGDLVIGEMGADPESDEISRVVLGLGTHDYCQHETGRLYWESLSTTRKALVVARKVWKAVKAKRPYPDWAVKALAEDWKPPKGWIPPLEGEDDA